jgi:hypothetical protein
MNRFAPFFLAGAAASIAHAAIAQNLLANGDFDSDLSGWNAPEVTPTWSSFDVDASTASGSAWFANTQAGAGVRQVVIAQCIPITQTGAYIFGGAAYTPTGQASTGYLVGSYLVDVHHADCSGGWSAVGGFFMNSPDQWTRYATTGGFYRPLIVDSLNPDASILVEFSVEKTDADGSFGGYFDAIYLIRDTLFFDGFD